MRTEEPEILDTEGYGFDHLAREEMDRLNRFFGVYSSDVRALAPLLRRLYRETGRPLKVLEIGFGFGGLLRALHHWGVQESVPLELHGVERSPAFLEYTQQKVRRQGLPFQLFFGDASRLVFLPARTYDACISTFTLHHCASEEMVDLLRETVRVGRHGYFRDFCRSLSGVVGVWLATRALGCSRTTRIDGVRSVRRAYRVTELEQIVRGKFPEKEMRFERAFPFGLRLWLLDRGAPEAAS